MSTESSCVRCAQYCTSKMGISAHSQQTGCTLALQVITCFVCCQWTYTDDTNYHTEVKPIMEKNNFESFFLAQDFVESVRVRLEC